MYRRNGDISFFCEKEWTGSVSPCLFFSLSFSRLVLPSSVFFSEPSNQFPSTDCVTWDYSYAGCCCRRKTLAEASEKHSAHGLDVKEADSAALFRNVRSDFLITRWEPPASVTAINAYVKIFGNFEALTLVKSTGCK